MANEKIDNALRELVQRDRDLTFRIDHELGVVRELRGRLAEVGGTDRDRVVEAARGFVAEHSDLFGDVGPDNWEVISSAGDPAEGLSVTLQQNHGEVPVYAGSLRLHVDGQGILDVVDNRLFPDLRGVPKEPEIDAEKAVERAQEKLETRQKPSQEPRLWVYRHKGRPHLAWRVVVRGEKNGERGVPPLWVAWIDATDGELLLAFDDIQTAGPVVDLGTGYYSGGGNVNAWDPDATHQLRDTTRSGTGGPEIITNDEDGASPSEDGDGNWNDATTTPRDANQGAEVDAHRYAAAVIDYFQTVHGRNSYDAAGADVTVNVHVGTDYNNGYWSPSAQQVFLGDGSGAAPGDDYETTDDWLAHEITHAYTQFTCGLQYLNESGALNESFSDVFAAFITGDWLVFEDSWLQASAPAWRNMIDPTNGGMWNVADPLTSVLAGHQPSHWNNRYVGSIDNGGVHINSGIVNHLFYLLTVGGTHTISGVAVTGIGQSAAEQMLFRVMTVNLVGNPTATFLDFRSAMLDACLTLFPGDLQKLSQVKNAFNAVGVGPDLYVRDNLADNGLEPYGGSYLWASPDVVNRTALLADPATDLADLNDDALWENVEAGQDNFVYVRVQNRGNQVGDTTINVYFIAATSFGTPASWIHVGSMVETGIAPGALRVAGPLTFPQALIPAAGQHFCMLAVLSDRLDPAPDHTAIASVGDYVNYVRNTNNLAYRNMDVVDDVPGLPGNFRVGVKTLPGRAERFDLHLDLARFVPGARVRLRGPARQLAAARPRGVKLVERREDGDAVYEVLQGDERLRRLEFEGVIDARPELRRPELPRLRPELLDRRRVVIDRLQRFEPIAAGFDGVVVDEDFEVEIEYVLPREAADRRVPKGGYPIALRQIWKGEEVGAAGLRVRPKG